MAKVATIGVYGFDLGGYLDALRGAGVDVVVDVRQRRGVRGPEYAWANARRLQVALEEAGIGYAHMKELAPTTELRQLQYREDDRRGEGKRSRSILAPEYARRYRAEILADANLEPLLRLARSGLPALMCVERDPEACHRSLIAERLRERHGVEQVDLRPS